MVVGEPKRSIMDGIENTGDVRLHDHRLRLKQRFDIIRKLGQGTYGKVQLGINKKTGQEVAIKTIKKCKIETEADLVRIRREVQIMSSVRHPNIVHIYEVFENSEKMILVMEYCAGGELYDYLSQQKVLQEDEARRLFRQIATAVYYCHKHKICHRDLKLENVLLDEHGSAKIADFGLSNVFEERRLLSTFCGSPLYASPEIVKGTPYIGPEVDCWSLGVLLYTLVYGAMPFDGSNFKRLVKQISTGDYFEPKSPSSASPLIRDMLTVDPIQRADITHICDNPWVNKGSDVSCLELAEALANETPVRLDLLLSLVPPPSIGGDKLVVTDEVTNAGADGSPARSMSVANIDNSAERRILEMVAEGGADAIKPSPTRTIVNAEQPKRKLETTVSMDSAPSQRKKERSIRSSSLINQNSLQDDASMTAIPNVENNGEVKNIENISPENEVKSNNIEIVPLPPVQHQESVTFDISPKLPNLPITTNMSQLTLEIPNEPAKIEPTVQRKSPEKASPVTTLANKETKLVEPKVKENVLKEKNVASKTTPALKKRIVTSSLNKDDKAKSMAWKEKSPPRKSIEKDITGRVLVTDKKIEDKKPEETPAVEPPKQRTTERRRSRILDTAEKLNNLSIQPTPASTENQQSPPLPKPKKVVIPGVSVGSFKEQFERRASLTSAANVTPVIEPKKSITKPTPAVGSNTINNKPLPVKKINSVDSEHPSNVPVNENKDTANIRLVNIGVEPTIQPREEIPAPRLPQEIKKPAIVEVNRVPKILHKSESLKEPSKNEPEYNLSLESARRSLQQSMALLTQARSESKPSMSSNDDVQNDRQKQLKTAREIISNAIGDDGKKVHRVSLGGKPPVPYGSGGRSSSGTISLSSMNSLPGSPPTSPPHARIVRESPGRTFLTEVHHRVDDVRNMPHRGGSVERIIPIHFAEGAPKVSNTNNSSSGQLPYQRNNSVPYRFSSLPRGCTSDTENESVQQPSTPIYHSKPEPIKKSPKEFIIPIAVEGKGYVTPRQGSLEPSDTPSKLNPANISFMSRFPKPRRINSLVSGGESEDDDDMHMHRLRSTRRVRTDAEKESVSSGEEDEDERFEILTAENLFSTLLDRVRSLTNRLNGEEGTGFSQLHQPIFPNLHSQFFNSPHLPRTHKRHNVMRDSPSWSRSTSRDLGPDFESMFRNHPTFPRGSRKSRQPATNNTNKKTNTNTESNTTGHSNESVLNDEEHLDLSDLDLSKMKLSEKDMEMLSGLTPALSRRIQKQLLDFLPPAAAKSLQRTLSMNNPYGTDNKTDQHKYYRSLSASKTINKEKSLIEEDNAVKYTKINSNKQDDDDASSISQSSMLGNPDKLNNNLRSSTSYDYSDSILLRDQSANSLDLNSSRLDSLSESVTPRLSVRNTPDRSVLRKYLSPERSISKDNNYSHKIESKDDYFGSYDLNNPILDNLDSRTPVRQRSLKTPPIDNTPRRRISRFLRPDFFDTPREESIYVRDKKDKETETQRVLREIRDKKIKSGASSPSSPCVAHDILPFFENDNYSNGNCLSPLSPLTPSRSRSVTPFYPILDNINEIQHDVNKTNKEQYKTVYTFKENVDNENTTVKKINKTEDESKISKLIRPKSFPLKNENLVLKSDNVDDISDTKKYSKDINEKPKESKMIRPKSYPTTTPSPEKKLSNIPITEINNLKPPMIEKKPIDTVNNNLNILKPIVRNISPVTDDNGNINVSFNINLPSKTQKTEVKVEENTEEKKLAPVKKKIVVKKKVVSQKTKSSTKTVVENTEADSSTKVVVAKETEPKIIKKKSVLQSLGQKFEKLRNDSFSKSNSNDKEITPEKSVPEKKATQIENSIRTLREQSVPNVMYTEPTTESGLIKRAVTVTDLQTLNNKENQSKKSVNRVFGLFKKIDSKDKTVKSPEISKENISEPIVTKITKNDSEVTLNIENKPKRPTSLLLNGIGKRVQACYNGATSDSILSKAEKKSNNIDPVLKSDEIKTQKKGLRLDFSRLPKINQGIFAKRNSLDLTKNNENKDVNDNPQPDSVKMDDVKPDSSELKNGVKHDDVSNGDIPSPLLDSCWSPDYDTSKFISDPKSNQYDNSGVQSDIENDVTSPETENLIDRIRRKSFYSRFNEKKNRRKSSLVGPGAKEYIPSARINPQCDNDNMHYTNKYDLSPTLSSPKYNISSSFNYEPNRSTHLLDKPECLSPTSSRLRMSEQFSPLKGLERNDKKYSDITIPGSYDTNQYSIPRYSRTLLYFDNYDSKQPIADPKSSRSRYGRTLSLLSPGIYATYSPRSHTRNSAILLKEATEVENSTENILSKIRNRKKNNYDDGQALETKFRSNQMHDSEHDLPAEDTE